MKSYFGLAICIALCLAVPGSVFADLSTDFEIGLGHNFQAIGTQIPGLTFTTVSGGDVYFADINSNSFSAKSDNGKVFGLGEYFVSGDVAGYILDSTDKAKISFNRAASYFTVGYSSQYPFAIEAYNSSGSLLASATGPANTLSKGGTGLSYLTVTYPGIDHVLLHDQGGFWMVDNISLASVPEPPPLIVLATGIAGLVFFRRRRQRSPSPCRSVSPQALP